MISFESSTNIVPLLNPGTYWGPLNIDSCFNDYIDAEREEGYLVRESIDFKAYGEAIRQAANRVFNQEKPLEEYGVKSIKATKFDSPREYNFADDWLNLTFKVEDTFIDDMEAMFFAPENLPKVANYIEENWKTRDGFWSYMPESVEDFREAIQQFRMHHTEDDRLPDECQVAGGIVAMLFYLTTSDDEEATDLTACLTEEVKSVTSLTDFYPEMTVEKAKKLFKNFHDYRRDMEDLQKTAAKYIEVMKDQPDSIQRCNNWLRKIKSELDHYWWRQENAIMEEVDLMGNFNEEAWGRVSDQIDEVFANYVEESETWQKFWTDKD